MPTRAPLFDSATARFTATVVLPTPPLPAPTAITFLTPGSGGLPCSGADDRSHLERRGDVHGGHARQRGDGGARLLRDQRLGRDGAGLGQLDREGHAAVGADDVLDESERDDVLLQVGVGHGLQCGQDQFRGHKKFSLPRRGKWLDSLPIAALPPW